MGQTGRSACCPSLRYAHAKAYMRRLAGLHGSSLRELQRAPLRQSEQQALDALYVYLDAPARVLHLRTQQGDGVLEQFFMPGTVLPFGMGDLPRFLQVLLEDVDLALRECTVVDIEVGFVVEAK